MSSYTAQPLEGTSVDVGTRIPAAPRPPGEFTELRIHGAGGARLNWLLDTADVVRVAGDEEVGFYRPADPNADTEGYYWGRFNSGGGWRAGWVLLVPFLLSNLVGWFLPRNSETLQGLARVFGLCMSVAAVYWTAAIATDLVALQCGGQPVCVDAHFWLPDWVFSESLVDHPGQRFVVGLLVPVALLFVLWFWPGRRSADRYERFELRRSPTLAPDGTGAPALTEDRGKLWFAEAQVRRLAGYHVLAVLAALALGTAGTTWWLAGREFDAGAVIGAFALVLVVWCLGAVARTSPDPAARRLTGYGLRAWTLGGALLASAAVYAWTTDVKGSSLAAERRIAIHFANGGFAALAGLMFLLMLVFLLVAFRQRKERPIAFGPPGAAGTALVVLGLLLSGAALWTADLLGERPSGIDTQSLADIEFVQDAQFISEERQELEKLVDDLAEVETLDLNDVREVSDLQGRLNEAVAALGTPQIAVSPAYDIAAIAGLTLLVAAALCFGLIKLLGWRRIVPSVDVEAALTQFAKNAGKPTWCANPTEFRRWTKQVAGDLRETVRNTRLRWLLYVGAGLAPLLFVGYVLLFFKVFDINLREFVEPIDFVLDPARWLLLGVVLGAGWLVRNAFSPGSTDRALGGLWDISVFWPRHFHPFSPPSYATRAVPEFAARIRDLRGKTGAVLVSAHSQGVPIAVAAIASLDDAERVALLSYGSPTGSLYAAYFPDYFDCAQLERFACHLGGASRWRNLWRLTDWTGGYAFGPSTDRIEPVRRTLADPGRPHDPSEIAKVVDQWLQDPSESMVRAAQPPIDPLPAPAGHNFYRQTEQHKNAWLHLRDELRAGPDGPN